MSFCALQLRMRLREDNPANVANKMRMQLYFLLCALLMLAGCSDSDRPANTASGDSAWHQAG